MRTVTFSDERVARKINANLIATWTNRNPGFHNCEFWTEENIAKNSGESYATRNFCTFFTTPDGTVLHYLAGYHSPRWFLPEVDLVLAVRKAGFDEKMEPREDRTAVADLHRDHLRRHRSELRRLERALRSKSKDPEREVVAAAAGGLLKEVSSVEAAAASRRPEGKQGERFEENARYLKEALSYFCDLHEKLDGAFRSGKSVMLEDVIRNYEAPNRFTEE